MGAVATYCCARLLVARANRAVTVFVVAFNVAFAVFILSFRKLHSVIHTARHPTQEPSFNRSFRYLSFRYWGVCFFHPQYLRLLYCSALLHKTSTPHTSTPTASLHYTPHAHSFRHLPFPTHAPNKNSASPAVNGRHPQSSKYSGYLCLATLAPLADGSRLSTTQAKKSLRIATPIFYLLRSGSRLFYLFGLIFLPHQHPDHPPLKKQSMILLFV